MPKEPESRVRLDKWLWAARFYKSRQLAIEAINGGKVHVNGQRCKPGKEISVGSLIEIQRNQLLWHIIVRELKTVRRPASEAVLLYEETPESVAKRTETEAQRKLLRQYLWEPSRRPSKRDRRLIHHFKRVDDSSNT